MSGPKVRRRRRRGKAREMKAKARFDQSRVRRDNESPRHHATMPPCHHATTLPRHHAKYSPRNGTCLPHSPRNTPCTDSPTKPAKDGQSAGRRSPNNTTKTASKQRGSSRDDGVTSSNSGGGFSDSEGSSDSDDGGDTGSGGSGAHEQYQRAMELMKAARRSTTAGELKPKGAQAVKIMTALAEAGHANSQQSLGAIYHDGLIGQAKDRAMALKWYR